MSYVTVEVEIDHGKVVPRRCEDLPERGIGLLTILRTGAGESDGTSTLEALELLQKHLQMDMQKAAQWSQTVSDARR